MKPSTILHSESSSPLLRAALDYVGAGWAVFPCDRDKRPLVARGFHAASTDPTTVTSWWKNWPQASIGAAVPMAFAVIDVDPRHGGDATLHALATQHGPLAKTLTVLTGGGGRHLYVLHPVGNLRQGAGILGPGLDTRMPGRGYVILPPSPHQSERQYAWEDPDVQAAPMPSWMVEALRPPELQRSPPPPCPQVADAYARAALEGELAAVAGAPIGMRNATLHVGAVKLGSLVGAGLLLKSDVVAALLDGARACGVLDDDGERAARATIRSGVVWGMRNPREVRR